MTAHEMIAKARNFPPISSAALQLMTLLEKQDSSNEDVVRALKQDIILTAKLLRACNSPAQGLAEPVSSVDQALLLMGHAQVFRMVTAVALRGHLLTPLQAYGMDSTALWQHSLLAAAAAEELARSDLGFGVDVSTAFTIGLLHDIGKLITNEHLSRELLLRIREQVVRGRSFVEAEKALLGADHAEVGASLLYLWRIPEPIVEGVGLHHQTVLPGHPNLSALAFLADRLAHLAGAPASIRAGAVGRDSELFESVGLSAERVEALTECVRESLTCATQVATAA